MPTEVAKERTLRGLTGWEPVQARGATLVPDLDDPFFFDHPLDHVPGMLLVTGLLDLVLGGVVGSGGRVRTALWFPRFCELDEPVELRACPAAGGTWSVLATGGGEAVCLGTVSVRLDDPEFGVESRDGTARTHETADEAAGAGAADPTPAAGRLVHRERPENVLVAEVCIDPDRRRRAAVLSSPRPDHFFSRSGLLRRPEELIEAARQATIMRALTDYEWPADTRFSLNQLRADLPATVDREAPLVLQWSPVAPPGRTAHCRIDLVGAGAGSRPTGRVVIDTQRWTGREWRQIRSRRR